MNISIYKNPDTQSITIDISKFLRIQKDIYLKYEDKIAHNSSMEKIDKYILQTLEELYELEDANKEEFKYELVDLIMYIGSTIYSIGYSFMDKSYNSYIFNYIENSLNKIYFTNSKIKYTNTNDIDYGYIFNNLIAIRRMYSERKWHKEVKKLTIEEQEKRKIESLNLLKDILDYAFIIYYKNTYDFNLIDTKENYILSL